MTAGSASLFRTRAFPIIDSLSLSQLPERRHVSSRDGTGTAHTLGQNAVRFPANGDHATLASGSRAVTQSLTWIIGASWLYIFHARRSSTRCTIHDKWIFLRHNERSAHSNNVGRTATNIGAALECSKANNRPRMLLRPRGVGSFCSVYNLSVSSHSTEISSLIAHLLSLVLSLYSRIRSHPKLRYPVWRIYVSTCR